MLSCLLIVTLLLHSEGILFDEAFINMGSVLLVLMLVSLVCVIYKSTLMTVLQTIAHLFPKGEINDVFSREGFRYHTQVVRILNIFTWSYDYHFSIHIWEQVWNNSTPKVSIFSYIINAEVIQSHIVPVDMKLPVGVLTPSGRIDRFQHFLRGSTITPRLMSLLNLSGSLKPSRLKFVLTRIGDT